MGLIEKPHTFTAFATKAGEAAQVNINWDVLFALVNGELSDPNFSPFANIQQSKILNLTSDLAAITSPAPVRTVVKQAGEFAVENTTIESPLIGELIPGAVMGTNGVIHGSGNLLVSILDGSTCQIRIFYNAQIVLVATIVNSTTFTQSNIPVRFDFRIHARNSTTVLGGSASLDLFGISPLLFFFGSNSLYRVINVTGLNGDTGVAMPVQVNILWNVASPTNSVSSFGFDMFAVK